MGTLKGKESEKKIDGYSNNNNIIGYTIQEEDKVCDNKFLLNEWGPDWKSDEGINACREECNKDLDCNAFSWFDNFTCKTYSECDTLIDNEFKSKAYTYKK